MTAQLAGLRRLGSDRASTLPLREAAKHLVRGVPERELVVAMQHVADAVLQERALRKCLTKRVLPRVQSDGGRVTGQILDRRAPRRQGAKTLQQPQAYSRARAR